MNIQIAMENGDFPIKHDRSFHCYVSSPEGNGFEMQYDNVWIPVGFSWIMDDEGY